MGTVDAEIKVLSAENFLLKKAPSFSPGGGQNKALYASHTARISAFRIPDQTIQQFINNKYISKALNPSVMNQPEARSAVHVQLKPSKQRN